MGIEKTKPSYLSLYKEQKGICPLCNEPLYEDPLDSRNHVDHIYPVNEAKKNGWTKEQMHDKSNLQIVHGVCNIRKGDSLDYFLEKNGK